MTKQTKTATFSFSFTTYQISLLAALDMGAETSVEIMETLGETIDKFARRRVCEAIVTLTECGLLEAEMIGGTRFASIAPEAETTVLKHLKEWRLAAA